MIIQEPGALARNHFLPEHFVLQELQEMQTHRVFEVNNVGWLLPIEEIGKVVDEGRILHETPLREKMKIIWVSKTLYKLQFDLKPKFGVFLRLPLHTLYWAPHQAARGTWLRGVRG